MLVVAFMHKACFEVDVTLCGRVNFTVVSVRFVGVVSLVVGHSSVVDIWKMELISCSRLVSWSELLLCMHIASFEIQKFIAYLR